VTFCVCGFLQLTTGLREIAHLLFERVSPGDELGQSKPGIGMFLQKPARGFVGYKSNIAVAVLYFVPPF
jgi:hypothetical protein